MSCRKISRLTNMWSKVVEGEEGEWLSRVIIESTKPYAYAAGNTDGKIIIQGKDVIINMPQGKIEVNDGLLREVNLKPDEKDVALVELVLDHPAEFRLAAFEGFPFRLEVALDRSFITSLFSGKKIVVDPGHGGKDCGGRGTVSLLEKDVVVPIAKNLEKILRRAGAEVILTRSGDEDISVEDRIGLARRADAGVFISIHTHAGADSSVEGAATLYAPSNGQSARLAGYVQEELLKKLKVRDRGVAPQPGLAAESEMLAIEVEVVSITNLVEEVFLRGLTIQKRAAEGIFNGLIKFFAGERQNSKGDYN